MVNAVTQAVVIAGSPAANEYKTQLMLALFNEDGTPWTAGGAVGAATTANAGTVKKMPAQVDTVAADLTALKVDFNALLAKMRTAGMLT